MIKYLPETKTFLLSGKNYSYVMSVTDTGFLQHVHYGGRVTEADAGYLNGIADTVAPHNDLNMDMAFDSMLSEYGFYARGDFREPTAVFERADGSAMSRLRYEKYDIFGGVPEITGMPHVRCGGETLVISLKDDFSDIRVKLIFNVDGDSNVLVRNVEIENTGKESITLKRAFSFCAELANGRYRALKLEGTWGTERSPEISPVSHGITRLHTLRGASSHNTNPFLGILKEECSEERGECYGFQLIYSGSFAITAEYCKNGPLRIQGGINDFNFGWKLGGGEVFTTPQVALCYSDGGLGALSRSYHDFLRDRIINPKFARKRRPVVINNWEGTYFDFDKEKLFKIIDAAENTGIDMFVLDDGWFGKRDSDTSGLGDWFVNEKKLKGGLKAITDRCKQRGLKFGLWFEPEMICEDSDLFRGHPDFAISKQGVVPCRSRNQLVLDFTRKDVVDHVFGAVSEILSKNDISYVKWDMNRNITECWSSALPADRQGEFMHRYILGVYELAERLTSAFPDIMFEGCAGGGGRFDTGALYYFPQIWTSDDTDGYERTKIQYGTSMCYPLSSMSCHVSVCPNHQTGRITPLSTRGNIASLGATGYELDLSKLSDKELEEIKVQIQNYHRIEDLILNGDLYRLASSFEGNYFCEMVVSKDKTAAYVVGERAHGDPCDYNRYLRLRGLDKDKLYHIEELGITASGEALENYGLLFPRLSDFGSWNWHIAEIKN